MTDDEYPSKDETEKEDEFDPAAPVPYPNTAVSGIYMGWSNYKIRRRPTHQLLHIQETLGFVGTNSLLDSGNIFSAISKGKWILLSFINFLNGVKTWQRSGQKKFTKKRTFLRLQGFYSRNLPKYTGIVLHQHIVGYFFRRFLRMFQRFFRYWKFYVIDVWTTF